MSLVVGKYALQVLYHGKGIPRHAVVIRPQPDENLRRVPVDEVHQVHLLAALAYIPLIDADLVGP